MTHVPAGRAVRTCLGFVVAAALLAATGCTPAPSSRVLTDEEADRLAAFRFVNYRAGEVTYAFTAPEGIDAQGTFTVKTAEHVGSGVMGESADPRGAFAWSETSVFENADVTRLDDPQSWQGRAVQQNTFDALLLMTLMLSDDRPDNPQLLQQGAAR